MGSRRALLAALVLGALVVGLSACASGDPDIEVLGSPQAAEPVAGSSQVALTLANTGDGDDRLVGARTDAALAVELHRTDLEGGRATMQVLETVDLPAGEQVRFRPGETHLMLVIPDESVRRGGTLTLVLDLERSGELTVEVAVVDLLDLVESAADEDTDEDATD